MGLFLRNIVQKFRIKRVNNHSIVVSSLVSVVGKAICSHSDCLELLEPCDKMLGVGGGGLQVR